MKRKPERIDGVVKSIIENLDKNSNPRSEDVEKIWSGIVGEKASAHTRPASLRKKRLVVNVDSSSWLYELSLKKEELISGLKKRLGKDKIEGLQFRIGGIKD